MLTKYFLAYPNAKVVQTSIFDQHHSIYRVSWKVILENGDTLVELCLRNISIAYENIVLLKNTRME